MNRIKYKLDARENRWRRPEKELSDGGVLPFLAFLLRFLAMQK